MLIKLVNGQQIIAYVGLPTNQMGKEDFSFYKFDRFLYTFFPALVTIDQERDKINLVEWMPLSKENYFPIPIAHILVAVQPSDRGVDYYFDWAKSVDFGDYLEMIKSIQKFFNPADIQQQNEPLENFEQEIQDGGIINEEMSEELAKQFLLKFTGTKH